MEASCVCKEVKHSGYVIKYYSHDAVKSSETLFCTS